MNILQLQKKLFNPDSYTEKNNPFLSAIARELNNGTDLGYTSSAIHSLQEKHSELFNEFINSLNPLQEELYEQLTFAMAEENSAIEIEHFNRGFKIAVKLMTECLDISKK